MAVQYFNDFKIPCVNSDVKGDLPQLNGRVWYHNFEHRFKYKKKGKNVTIADLEELGSEEGAGLIGVKNVPRLGSNLQQVIENFNASLENVRANIKWRKPVKHNVSYIRLGEGKFDTSSFLEEPKYNTGLLDIPNKRFYLYRNGWGKGTLVSADDSFIFKTHGDCHCKDSNVIPNPTNRIYYGSTLVELDIVEGYTCRVLDEKKIYTYCETEWVQSLDMGDHDLLVGVRGGEIGDRWHITEKMYNLLEALVEEEESSARLKVYKAGPVILKNPIKVEHTLGTCQLSVTIQNDNDGKPGTIIQNGYSVLPVDDRTVIIHGLSGKFWIKMVGAQDPKSSE